MAHKELGQKTLSNLMKDCETWLVPDFSPNIIFLACLTCWTSRAKVDQRPMMEVTALVVPEPADDG